MIYSHYLHQKSSSFLPISGPCNPMSFCTCVATSLRSRSSLPPRCAFRFAHSLVVCATSTKPPFLQGLMALTTAQLEWWEHDVKLTSSWGPGRISTGHLRFARLVAQDMKDVIIDQLPGCMGFRWNEVVALCHPMWQHITAQNDEPMNPQNEAAEQLRWQIHGHFGKLWEPLPSNYSARRNAAVGYLWWCK